MPATSDSLTLGVEEEFLLVDPDDGRLVPRVEEVIANLQSAWPNRIEREMNRCQVELSTTVHRSLTDLEAELVLRREDLAGAAAAAGCAILPTATHPFSPAAEQQVRREEPRFDAMWERYRLIAEQQVVCGAHFHVGMGDRDTDVRVARILRPWLPVLLALSANSPFWEGQDTGYASFRSEVWLRWPTAGFPPPLDDAAAFERHVAQLVEAEVVADSSYLYWYLRPSMVHPTLECRVVDIPLHTEDTVTLAGLYRGLAAAAMDGALPDPDAPSDLLDAAMWRAGRYGLQERLLDPLALRPVPAAEVVDTTLVAARDALVRHGDLDRVTTGVQQILERGTGSERQRRLAETAPDEQLVRELRTDAGAQRALPAATGASPTG